MRWESSPPSPECLHDPGRPGGTAGETRGLGVPREPPSGQALPVEVMRRHRVRVSAPEGFDSRRLQSPIPGRPGAGSFAMTPDPPRRRFRG